MSPPITWLPPPSFQGEHPMAILPWVSLYQDPLSQETLTYPTDACLQRAMHHFWCEGIRGEVIRDIENYTQLYPDRIKKEQPAKTPELKLVASPGAEYFPSVALYMEKKEHNRLVTGERWINSRVKTTMTHATKHHGHVPPCSQTYTNIQNRLPPETAPADLDLAQKLLKSNLARNTRKHNNSVQRTLTTLIPERDIFANPKPGDKELLTLRLMQKKPHLAASSLKQYLKSYNSILLDKGLDSPTDTHLFKRIIKGHENRNFNPREKAAQPKRQAHTTETLTLLAHALNAMGPTNGGPWQQLRVQALFTAAMIAFWACARLSDLCGAEKNSYSTRTTLLEKDFTLMFEEGQVTGLEIFFGSEKVPHLEGSRVQLPKIPPGPLQQLCPVSAYIRYQKLKKNLHPQASAPWLIDFDGQPILQRNLTPWYDAAIEQTFGNTALIHILRKLRGHSFRSALPTQMQSMALTPEEKKAMGRWLSDEAYRLYCKNKTNNRMNIAQQVIDSLQNS